MRDLVALQKADNARLCAENVLLRRRVEQLEAAGKPEGRTERGSQGCTCPKYGRVLWELGQAKEQIERLRKENDRLRQQLGKERRTALERPFGLSTPSGKMAVNASSPEPASETERKRRMAGARPGHAGHGWQDLGEPDEVVELPDPDADIAHLLFGGLDLALPHLPRGLIRELPAEVTTHPPATRPAPT